MMCHLIASPNIYKKKQRIKQKQTNNRGRELSPCKENDMPNNSSVALSERSKRPNESSSHGGSSALDRLRYNLSPVASYYKPLIRSFGRRDESPAKVSKSND